MAVDEALLESAAADGQCTLRFYRWDGPTLSLGYFQSYDDRWQHAASSRSAVVRRASGGGAILHDHELTYSLAVPAGHPLALGRLRLYAAVHSALIEALAQWEIEASMLEPPNRPQADAGGIRKRQPFLCFLRRSPGDVLVGGAKVAGSAQRRCRGAVLQHGSVLLARSAAAPELAGLEELTGKRLAVGELLEVWRKKVAEALSIACEEGRLSEPQRRRAEWLTTQKYVCPTWTERLRPVAPL